MDLKIHNECEKGAQPILKGNYVKVHYIGKLKDTGKVFDKNQPGQKPFAFCAGVGQVIKGWDEAVLKLRKGQKATITCPPEYGYGASGAGGVIPPNATLIFDIEVVDVHAEEPPNSAFKILRWGMIFGFAVYQFDKHMSQFKIHKNSLPGLTQPMLHFDENSNNQVDFLDKETHKLTQHGYGINVEDRINDNSVEDAFRWGKKRHINFNLLTTPIHYATFAMPLDLGLLSINGFSVWDIDEGPEKLKKSEQIIKGGVIDGKYTIKEGYKLDSDALSFSFGPKVESSDIYELDIKAGDHFAINGSYDYNAYDSLSWICPLSDDLSYFFNSTKQIGIQLEGSYTYNGQTFNCVPGSEDEYCLLTTDSVRQNPEYGASYYWATFQTVLPDGRSLGISMSDGIGAQYSSNARASEDFVTLGGKVYKLDQSELTFDKEDYMKPHQIKSTTKDKLFGFAHCQFDFEPTGAFEEGANLLVVALRQSGVMGHYKGYCEIEGQSYIVDNAYGMLEHVWSRW